MKRLAWCAAAVLAAASCLAAARTTVCTVTVNSADEREAFRRYLPAGEYDFVELVERGRRDWLASSCARGVRCDVLLVSGHFAGTEFYSSRFDATETLPVGEVERVQCSDSCRALFTELKEVYLFGCDTLKPEPVKTTTAEIVRGLTRAGMPRREAERIAREASEREGESSREVMRRLFPGVPVIYGFSSLAPYGRTAGPMLARYFESAAAAAVGTGIPSAKLLALFGPASMTSTAGIRGDEPAAAWRAEACRFADERVPFAAKLAFVRQLLVGEMPEVRMSFDRIEKFVASASGAAGSAWPDAVAPLAADRAARDRYLGIVRDTTDPALRVRMIALARDIDWLSPAQARDETVRMIGDLMAAGDLGYGEVDLICALNRDGTLAPALRALSGARAGAVALAAAQACLGNEAARTRMLHALASPREAEVQIAQAYLRHRPIERPDELRLAALDVARMAPSPAQVRAIETLARQHVEDREVLDELARLFARSTSLAVQRAIAEVFLRADAHALGPGLARMLRSSRVPAAGEDLIDLVIRRLEKEPAA